MKHTSLFAFVGLTLTLGCSQIPKEQKPQTVQAAEKGDDSVTASNSNDLVETPLLKNSILRQLFEIDTSKGYTRNGIISLPGYGKKSLQGVTRIKGYGMELHTEGFEDLEKMPNLETLTLGGKNSTLTDEDLKKIAKLKLPKIKNIHLAWASNISAEGVSALLKSFPTLKNITVLACPKITEKEGRALEAMLPGCTITGYWNFEHG